MKTVIPIKGPIIDDGDSWMYNWLKKPYASVSQLKAAMPEDGSDVLLEINSGGGVVSAASEICEIIKSYTGSVTANILGMCASAATMVALATDHVAIAEMAQFMIHNASASAAGDDQDMRSMANALGGLNQSLAKLYAAKTGKSVDESLELMKATTYLNADQAVEQGFVDEVMGEKNEEPLQLVASAGGMLDESVVGKMKALKNTLIRDESPSPEKFLDALRPLIKEEIATQLNNNKSEPDKPINDADLSRFAF